MIQLLTLSKSIELGNYYASNISDILILKEFGDKYLRSY